MQYRLNEVKGGTLIALRHTALGFMPDKDRAGVGKGWTYWLEKVRERAEAARAQ
jgi:hypothetical protein